jgi:hypothetical protein
MVEAVESQFKLSDGLELYMKKWIVCYLETLILLQIANLRIAR